MKELQGVEIILVDDDPVDRELFMAAVEATKIPCVVHEAKDAATLLSALAKNAKRPNIIFLDLNMPVKGGKQILRELKADKRYKTIPVVIFSTSSSQFDINEAYEAGASLYVMKPHDFNDQVSLVNHLLLLSKYISFPL